LFCRLFFAGYMVLFVIIQILSKDNGTNVSKEIYIMFVISLRKFSFFFWLIFCLSSKQILRSNIIWSLRTYYQAEGNILKIQNCSLGQIFEPKDTIVRLNLSFWKTLREFDIFSLCMILIWKFKYCKSLQIKLWFVKLKQRKVRTIIVLQMIFDFIKLKLKTLYQFFFVFFQIQKYRYKYQ